MEREVALAARFLKNKGHTGGTAELSVDVLMKHLEELVGDYVSKDDEVRRIRKSLKLIAHDAFMPLELQVATLINWATIRLGVKEAGPLSRDEWDALYRRVERSVVECEEKIIKNMKEFVDHGDGSTD